MTKAQVHLIITALAGLLFLPGLGVTPLFDWDELNFAESAREMTVSNNWYYVQVAFEPFWEKPPLFIWLQALFLTWFGDSTWVYRLPNALAGVITVNLAYHIGCYLGRRTLGVFWSLAMALSFAPLLYFKSGIIDPVFNLLIFLAIWHWYRITRCESEGHRPHWHYFLSGVFIGLATLAKGQVAILVLGTVTMSITAYRGRWQDVFSGRIFILLFGFTLVVGGWILSIYQHLGGHFFNEFILYQIELVKGQIPWHNQPWFYHILVLFFLCFPSAALAIPYLFKRGEEDFGLESWHAMMRTLFWIVLLIFSLVTTKIIHYSSLCWFPLTYFAAYHTYLIHTNRGQTHWVQKLSLTLSAVGLFGAMVLLPLIFGRSTTPQWAMPYLDDFALGLLSHRIPWTFTSIIPAALMLVLIFPWLIRNFLHTQWHPAKLLIGMGTVTLAAYFFLLPPAEKLLQQELKETIAEQKKITPHIETHGFKSFALYYHGKITENEMLGPWTTDTFVINRTQNQPYPKQWAKRIWIKDASHIHTKTNNGTNLPNARLITKSSYVADRYFRYQFNPIDSMGAYFVWERR